MLNLKKARIRNINKLKETKIGQGHAMILTVGFSQFPTVDLRGKYLKVLHK
jgi:hypothetical protein